MLLLEAIFKSIIISTDSVLKYIWRDQRVPNFLQMLFLVPCRNQRIYRMKIFLRWYQFWRLMFKLTFIYCIFYETLKLPLFNRPSNKVLEDWYKENYYRNYKEIVFNCRYQVFIFYLMINQANHRMCHMMQSMKN